MSIGVDMGRDILTLLYTAVKQGVFLVCGCASVNRTVYILYI